MCAVSLTWDDNNSGAAEEDGFKVYRSNLPIDLAALPVLIATLPPGTTAYDDLTPLVGDNYYVVSTYRAGSVRFLIFDLITVVVGWTPENLFVGGVSGVMLRASVLSTLWQDSARTIPVTAHNDPVGAWDDVSGNGLTFIQPVASKRPLYKIYGAYSCVEFDGVDDFLYTAYNATANIGCATVVVGAQINSTSKHDAGLLTNYNDQGAGVDAALTRQGLLSEWNSTQGTGAALANASHFWINGAQSKAITMGSPRVYSADGTGNSATNLSFPTGGKIGWDRSNAGRYLNGRVYGVVSIGNAAGQILSTTDRNKVEAWMASECGITPW